MALTSQIRSSEATFKLAQRLVESLSERFSINKDDAWNHVSSMTIDVINRKMRKERRKRNAASQVKKPRTAFSFFTQRQRPVIQAKNPTAKFGELSRLVSKEWKALTEAQLKEYKDFELTDRIRYNTELAQAKEKASTDGAAVECVACVPVVDAKPAKAPRSKTPKATVETVAQVVSDAKAVKSPKVKTPKAASTAQAVSATPAASTAQAVSATPAASTTPVAVTATAGATTPVGKKVRTPKQ